MGAENVTHLNYAPVVDEIPNGVDVEHKLTDVPETLLIPLWARAYETALPNPIIRDEKAIEMVSRIDYDFSKFEKVWMSQVGVAIRTEILDEAARTFIAAHPGALVVNLGAGLCTRFSRVDNGRITWYELDLPEVVALRHKFFAETNHHRLLTGSVADFNWMEQIPRNENQPLLLIGEGLFMYFEEPEVKRIFVELATRFPGAEMLFEILGPFVVGRSKHHDAVSKMDERPEFRWGISSGATCAEWDPRIQFVQEWSYIDRHRERFRFLRWVADIPWFRKQMMSKIVHLKFI
jgi:O-methyltransferase involved in polyketide biosynthesis